MVNILWNMDVNIHKNIVKAIQDYEGLSKDCFTMLLEIFSSVNHGTLCSILSLEYQKRMKYNHVKTTATINKYHSLYLEAVERGDPPGIIVKIGKDLDVSPCLVARLILHKYIETLDLDSDDGSGAQVNINKYLRDTSLIEDMDLAYEVFLCTMFDDQYSPIVEIMKSSAGQQYEIQLHRQMTDLGLAFRDEEYLRKFGYDKTPDFKLEVPIAVDGFIINWIESKALFADEDVHKDYIKHQYSSYWNRFGPGLVIYWFGFIESIVLPSDKRFIIRDHLPTNIVHIIKPDFRESKF